MSRAVSAASDSGAVEGGAVALRSLGGNGPRALLMHGFGSDRMSWLANHPAIEGVATVSALDLPGHGASGMDVGDGAVATLAGRVAAVMDENALSRVHLIGHSLGGGVAIELAATRPDLVASLALIAPAGLGRGLDLGFLSAFPTLSAPEETEALLQRLVIRPRLINRLLVERVLEQLDRPGARQALRLVAEGLARGGDALADVVSRLAVGALPRLVIWGEDDAINPLARERLAAFGGESLIIPGAGHLPHVENPRVVNERLLTFLARCGGT